MPNFISKAVFSTDDKVYTGVIPLPPTSRTLRQAKHA